MLTLEHAELGTMLGPFGIQPEATELVSFPLASQTREGSSIVHDSAYCQAECQPPVSANVVSILELPLDPISIKW